MKKILGMFLIVIMFFGLFYFFKQEEKKVIQEVVQSKKVWKVVEPKVKTPIIHKDKNSSLPNKKPTVIVYGFTIMSVGDVITLHSKAKDEDGKIVSYLWQEEGKILGAKPELPLMLSKEGKHTITLRVTDNLGAMAKSGITIDVFAPYDKKVFYKHRNCHCIGLIYSYYNDEGNLTKEITDNKEGIVIKEFTYNDKGELLSMHYKNYYDETNLLKNSTTLYDKFGHEIEEFGKKKDYGVEEEKSVSFHNRQKYNEKGEMIESSMELDGILESAEKHTYDKNGNKSDVYENYKDGLLESKNINLSSYDENGNLLSKTNQEYDVESETTTVSYREERRYNDAKQILEKRLDNDGNGEIDEYTYYQYDDANRLLEERYKPDNVSSESITSYTYSTEGLLLQKERKKEEKIENIKHYTYNSNGQETSNSTDSDGDGLIDYAYKTLYDSEGNRIREESYNNGLLSDSNTYNSEGKVVESNRNGYSIKLIYDEETGVLNHRVLEESSGQMSIKDYDDSGELIKEVDENGEVYYDVDRR